jgi:hypothetical protein
MEGICHLMKVWVIYDRQGKILTADWAVEGSNVGEFELPEVQVPGFDQVTEGGKDEDEEFVLLPGEEVPKGVDINDYRSWYKSKARDQRARMREALRLGALSLLRVDVDSQSLRPIEEGGNL